MLDLLLLLPQIGRSAVMRRGVRYEHVQRNPTNKK
jgi:hypothetical protein